MKKCFVFAAAVMLALSLLTGAFAQATKGAAPAAAQGREGEGGRHDGHRHGH